MSDIFERISDYGIVPLVTLEDPDDAVPLARALVDGGIPIAEVTFRTAAGAECIKRIAAEVPEIMVGAGTVHSVDQAKETLDNGGKFVITPGFNEQVVDWCVKNDIPVCPGAVAPSDIESAMNYGLKVVKFFPAEAYGGVKTLKSFAGPFAGIKFIPTGGVNMQNFTDYLDLPNVAAVGGSFVPPAKLVAEKDWEGVKNTCREITTKLYDFTVGHVGINAGTEENANAVHHRIDELFESGRFETPLAIFSGNLVEIMKRPFVGQMGHICVDTRDLTRALAMLERKGVEFNPELYMYDSKGTLITAYMKEEIGGFAFHVRQRPKKK